jgi:Tfp pilus assembly protein PilX
MIFVQRQRGAVLLITLIMLSVMTLFGLSMLNMQSTEWRVVSNVQSSLRLQADVQQAIEDILSDPTFFSAPAARSVTVNGNTVAIASPVCTGVNRISGYSAVWNVSVYESAWTVQASATDTVTAAVARVIQGVRVSSVSGDCP